MPALPARTIMPSPGKGRLSENVQPDVRVNVCVCGAGERGRTARRTPAPGLEFQNRGLHSLQLLCSPRMLGVHDCLGDCI